MRYNAVFHKSQNFNLGVSTDGSEYLRNITEPMVVWIC